MYRGKEPPAIVLDNGEILNLPKPTRDGRDEKYIPVGQEYENIDGEIITKRKGYRFEAEYKFHNFDPNVLEDIIDLYNEKTEIVFIPFSDLPAVRYLCKIDDLQVQSTYSFIDSVTIKIKSKKIIPKIPTTDNMYGVFICYRIIKYKEA